MIGGGTCRAERRYRGGARRCLPAASNLTGGVPFAAMTALFLALVLQCVDLKAELLFRTVELRNGATSLSAAKNYADPADTAYLPTRDEGIQVYPQAVQVFLQGTITQQDVYGAKVMESLVRRGRQRIAGNAVTLAGSGGDVDVAMELGRVLRRLGVSTLVERGEECLSSCVFAFMGGDRRTVAGQLGIHRPYFSSTRKVPDRRAHYRQLQKRLQQYIEELDFPPSLYEAVMAVPSESITIFSAADLKRFYLQGMSPSAQDEANAAAARNLGVSVMEYLRQKGQAAPCAYILDSRGECDRETLSAAGRGAAAVDVRETGTYDGALPAVGSFSRPDKADAMELGARTEAPASSWTTR